MKKIISRFLPLILILFFSDKVSSQLIARLTLHNVDSKIAAPVYFNLELLHNKRRISKKSYIVFMDYPTKYNFPKRMPVWPAHMNGSGDVFFSWSPTRNMDRPLYTDKRSVLKYRMLVLDGTISAAGAENIWKNFSHPPQITVSMMEIN